MNAWRIGFLLGVAVSGLVRAETKLSLPAFKAEAVQDSGKALLSAIREARPLEKTFPPQRDSAALGEWVQLLKNAVPAQNSLVRSALWEVFQSRAHVALRRQALETLARSGEEDPRTLTQAILDETVKGPLSKSQSLLQPQDVAERVLVSAGDLSMLVDFIERLNSEEVLRGPGWLGLVADAEAFYLRVFRGIFSQPRRDRADIRGAASRLARALRVRADFLRGQSEFCQNAALEPGCFPSFYYQGRLRDLDQVVKIIDAAAL